MVVKKNCAFRTLFGYPLIFMLYNYYASLPLYHKIKFVHSSNMYRTKLMISAALKNEIMKIWDWFAWICKKKFNFTCKMRLRAIAWLYLNHFILGKCAQTNKTTYIMKKHNFGETGSRERQAPPSDAVAADRYCPWNILSYIFGFNMKKCTGIAATHSWDVRPMVFLGLLM